MWSQNGYAGIRVPDGVVRLDIKLRYDVMHRSRLERRLCAEFRPIYDLEVFPLLVSLFYRTDRKVAL
jgi:hypothetical protein